MSYALCVCLFICTASFVSVIIHWVSAANREERFGKHKEVIGIPKFRMLPSFQTEGMSKKAKTLQISLHLVSVNFCLAVIAYSVNCHSHYCIRCWWCLLTLWVHCMHCITACSCHSMEIWLNPMKLFTLIYIYSSVHCEIMLQSSM